MKKILLATLACAGLCACSDEIDLSSGTTTKVFEGDKAYMVVSISEPGTSSTRATTSGFEGATSAEWATGDAYFYFFDHDGVFVSDGEVLQNTSDYTGSEEIDGTSDGDDPHYYYQTSKTQLILKDLTDKEYPKYVITVLNKPTDFNPGENGETPNIDEFIKLLSNGASSGIYKGGNTNPSYFVMSTTSFANQQLSDGEWSGGPMPYCVTELKYSDFHLEPVDLNSISNPVEIYVERLAAKVEVTLSETLQQQQKSLASEYTFKDKDGNDLTEKIYSVFNATVAGDDNDDDLDNDIEADDNLAVALLGWRLNATARNSYMIKNINEDWTDTFLPFSTTDGSESWNDPTNHRSYWGESYNYDVNCGYQTNSGGNTESDETTGTEAANDWVNQYLQYYDLQDSHLQSWGDIVYCAENTNTATNSSENGSGENDILNSKTAAPAITSVLLKARVYTLTPDAGSVGTIATYQTLVRYGGELFTEKAYKNYVLNYLRQTKDLNAYYLGTDGEYYPIDYEWVDLVPMRGNETYSGVSNQDGVYTVELGDKFTTELEAQQNSLYYKADYTNGSSEQAYVWKNITYEDQYSVINSILQQFNTSADAIGFKDGLMYYNVPIEHLREITDDDYSPNNIDNPDDGKTLQIKEANYGIVRNHSYHVSINSISNLGKGILNEEEVIVPDPADYLDNYYVGATITCTPWKVVNQTVDLGQKSDDSTDD